MPEKVHCAHGQYDGIILSGVADCQGVPCYFNMVLVPSPLENRRDFYTLTPLDEDTFHLEQENWSYWLALVFGNVQGPHPLEYGALRKVEPLDSLKVKAQFSSQENLMRAEKHYQNQLTIDRFLNSHPPTLFATAEFVGDRDGIEETHVTWTLIDKPL